jgi:hypothetical protein
MFVYDFFMLQETIDKYLKAQKDAMESAADEI